ncbi:MAG: hypothetical protein Q4C52_08990 [Eubacteriales bacterium]|nr:hypothetical protein [Eubacteriales bacterium]
MNGILELKGQLQEVYAKYSKYIDKAIQFILALITFYMINHNIGFMNMLKNPIITLGLSVVCAFLPPVFTVLAAAALVLGHVYSVSLGMVLVTAIAFLLMFIFYLRLAPRTAIVVLLMPLAYMLKIPAAVPVAFALVGTPVYAVPSAFGTIVYFMIRQVKDSAATLQTAEESGFIADTMGFAKQALASKEMWLSVAAVLICMLAVYSIRRSAVAHAWKIASAVGAVLYMVVVAVGGVALGVKASYGSLFAGAIAAVIIGLILEILFFAVDYAKCESLQYEDDEYYYYVKAIPKVGVAAPEKTVKRINKRDELRNESEVIDSDELRRKTKKPAGGKKKPQAKSQQKAQPRKNDPVYEAPERRQAKKEKMTESAEHLLLTRSLRKDLNLDEDGK